MSEWKEIKLEDFASLKYGKLPPKEIVPSGYPIWSGYKYVGSAETFNCPKDTPIVVARGVGGTGDVKIAKEDCFLTNLSISVSLKEEICNPHFFTYYFAKDNLRYLDSGSAQSQITIDALKKVILKLPPLQQQKKIVAVLSSLDEKIETNRKINTRLEELAQALFKSWFIDFEPFGGQMPKDWKTGILSDIANIVMGQSPKGECINSNQHGMIFYQGKTEFGDRFPSVKNFTTNITRVAPVNSVLLSVRAPVGDVNITLNECCIGRGIASIDYKYGSNSFLFLLLKNKTDYFDIFDKGGTVFGCINKKSLEEMPIFLPTTSTIASFNEILHPIDVELERRNNESARLAALRDTLLPKLMSRELKPE